MEEISVFGKLHSGISYSAVDCEFNVNESTIWYIQKREKEIWQPVCEPTPESAKVTSIVHEEATEKGLNLWIYKMTTIVKSIILRLKAKEIYNNVTQGHKNVKLC